MDDTAENKIAEIEKSNDTAAPASPASEQPKASLIPGIARRKSCQVRVPDIQGGWEYDPKAIEFEHAKVIHERNRIRRPPEHDRQADGTDYDKGAMIRRLRDGGLERANVRELAVHLSPLIALRRPDDNQCSTSLLSASKKIADPGARKRDRTGPTVNITKVNQKMKPPILPRIDEPCAGTSEVDSFTARYKHDTVRHVDAGNRRKTSVLDSLNVKPSQNDGVEKLVDVQTIDLNETIETASLESTDNELYEPLQWNPDGFHRKNAERGGAQHNFGATGMTNEVSFEDDFSSKDCWPLSRFEQNHHHHQAMSRFATRDDNRQHNFSAGHTRLGFFRNFGSRTEHQRFEDRLTTACRLQPQTQKDIWCESRESALDVLTRVQAALPPPKPPTTRKADLFKDQFFFSTIDRHAVFIARQDFANFEQVVHELKRACGTQLETARAIFQWLSLKNLNEIMFYDQPNSDSLHYLLGGITEGLESYHEVFRLLGSYADLPVKLINGISKSAGYQPGMSFSDGQFRNAWTAVHIDGEWRFVDCHWGSRHIAKSTSQSSQMSSSPLCYALDEFFFLADPDQFIYMHFPDDPEWQLLSSPISLDDFIAKPLIKSQLFHFGLEFGPGTSSVITSENGTIEVIIKRTNHKLNLAFNTRLEHNRNIVDGYVIYHKQKYDVIFNASLPKVGQYFLSIFACDIQTSDVFHNICTFQISCTTIVNKPFCRFPHLPDGYGLTPLAVELGLRVDKYDEYYLVSNRDKMTLDLNFTCPVKIAHKMTNSYGESIPVEERNSAGRTISLSSFAFQRYRDHSFVSYVLRFPERGIYLFSVYAGYKQSQLDTLECVVRYLIQCNTKPDTSKASSTLCAYPQTLQYWQRCRLHEPTAGQLRINKTITFKLEVPEAKSVAVIIGQQWYYLEKESSCGRGEHKEKTKAESRTDVTWTGSVCTGKDVRLPVTVSAKMRHEGGGEYCPLLEYQLYDSGTIM